VAKSSDNENLNLLVKGFGKYLKRKSNNGNQKRYNSKQNDSNNTPSFSYYNYGKQGHIKIECPNINKEKEKNIDKKMENLIECPNIMGGIGFKSHVCH